MSTGSSPLNLFGGTSVIALAGTYPSLLEAFLEMVQNAVDKGAKKIWIVLNLKKMTGAVQDNGDGASQEFFDRALDTVGRTMKKDDKMGRFGRGLVSPLDKCARWTFTSTPKGKNEYTEWSFCAADIETQRHVQIPFRSRKDLRYGEDYRAKGVTCVSWRTQIRLEGIKDNRLMNRVTIDSLCEAIADKYNEAMKASGTVVYVIVTDADGEKKTREVYPTDYTGLPLTQERVSNLDGGDTTFRMFLTRSTGKKGRTGRVKIGEDKNPFRIQFNVFAKNLPDGAKFSPEAVEALSSGIFEGDITSSRCEVQDHRRCFKAENSLLGFVVAVEEWFKKTGRQYYDQVAQARQDEKYERLAKDSLVLLRELAKTTQGQAIRGLIDTFSIGTIGSGHKSRRTAGDAEPGTEANKPSKPNGKGNGGGSDSTSDPTTEHEGHTPMITGGPNARPRKGVRDGSLGITLLHDTLSLTKLWEFDSERGVLTLNMRHPTWVECEERGDRVLGRFQSYLIVQALIAHSINDPQHQELALLHVEEATPPYAWMLIHESDLLFAGRKVAKSKSIVISAK